MIPVILGIKKNQTQYFTSDGSRIPVTHIAAGPCYVTKIEPVTDGIRFQLGFGIKKNMSKAEEGHLKKAGLIKKLRFLRSFKIKALPEGTKVGSEILVTSIFQPGDRINVTAMSKGKGFAGVVKRHGFRGGPRTHGQSDRERAPGSIGQTTTPGRVYRGKKMAGRMGFDKVTVRNLKIVGVSGERDLIISGLIPGPRNNFVVITKI